MFGWAVNWDRERCVTCIRATALTRRRSEMYTGGSTFSARWVRRSASSCRTSTGTDTDLTACCLHRCQHTLSVPTAKGQCSLVSASWVYQQLAHLCLVFRALCVICQFSFIILALTLTSPSVACISGKTHLWRQPQQTRATICDQAQSASSHAGRHARLSAGTDTDLSPCFLHPC